MCSPLLFQGDKPLDKLDDLAHHTLLHDSSRDAWQEWIRHFNVLGVNVNHGPIFSHSLLVQQVAALGQGIALGYSFLARPEIEAGRLICPFRKACYKECLLFSLSSISSRFRKNQRISRMVISTSERRAR